MNEPVTQEEFKALSEDVKNLTTSVKDLANFVWRINGTLHGDPERGIGSTMYDLKNKVRHLWETSLPAQVRMGKEVLRQISNG